MSTGNDKDQIDLETLSDEEFLKLNPDEIDADSSASLSEEEESEETKQEQEEQEGDVEENNEVVEEKEEGYGKKSEDDVSEETEKTPENPSEPIKSTDKPFTEQKPGSEEKIKEEQKLTEAAEKEKVKPEEDAQAKIAQDFYSKITTPFKADGKDFTIKNAEDAIRLMQQGVNYSRRMQELKPVRALNHMLTEHGLNDPSKLSFLIDVHNGKPEAIQKLLKDKNIDPLDINTNEDTTYQTSDYSINDKNMMFREAIESTISMPGGREVLTDINSKWDDSSKELLRENPEILNTLLEHKQNNIYEKTINELNYQQTMGYLKNIPYIQAYHRTAEALYKAGAFNSEQESPTSKEQPAPIDTGPRKATLNKKSEKPNQHISSLNQPNVAPVKKEQVTNEKDYSTLSDEEFLKLNVPG